VQIFALFSALTTRAAAASAMLRVRAAVGRDERELFF